MPKIKSAQKQKRYLQIGFAFVFAGSFAAVVLERNHVNQELARPRNEPLPLAEYVKGEAVERAPGIQDYRDIISVNLSFLNQVIDALLSGESAPSGLAQIVYQNLVAVPVPAPYRSMHQALISLAKEAQKSTIDSATLAAGRERLYVAYPWLIITADQ